MSNVIIDNVNASVQTGDPVRATDRQRGEAKHGPAPELDARSFQRQSRRQARRLARLRAT